MTELKKLPRLAAVHDISGFGKCSLTVALPIVSASGVECCCIPTALLSTHTGGFTDWTFNDLSEDIVPIARHWNSLGIHFDAIYSGYLASEAQGELLKETISLLRSEDTLVIVDPAMADNGHYYTNFDEKMAECFRQLIAEADVITPNITEACFITGLPYRSGPYERSFIAELIERLGALGPKVVAITGVSLEEGNVGIVAHDFRNDTDCEAMSPARAGVFHGAGDIFASSFAALLTRGAQLETALVTAEDFLTECIALTEKRAAPRHYGMDFESVLPQYILKVNELFNENT